MKLVGTALCALVLIACDEPYTVDANANKDPIVDRVIMRDALGDSHIANLVGDEPNAAQYKWDGTTAVFPFNYPWIIINKLLNGDTIETTAKDELTGDQLGNCGPKPGAVNVTVDGSAINDLRVCYNPTNPPNILVQPSEPSAGDPFAPLQFLQYESTYLITLNPTITDKQGKALKAAPLPIRVRPFEVVHVTNATGSNTLYGAPGTGFAQDDDGEDLTNPTFAASSAVRTVLRVVFSGPVAAPDEEGNLVLDPSLSGIQLFDSDGNLVTAMKDGKAIPASVARKAGSLSAAADLRIALIVPPQYTASAAKEGLPPGDYKLKIPASVTDAGTVTGSKVPLKEALEVEFTIAAPK